MANDNSKENKQTKIFEFVKYILDYAYKEFSSIPKDFLTEIHLRFYRHNKKPNKKILGYWDFNQRVSKLGDFMVFLEYLNILRHEFKLNIENNKNIDICFIDDNHHYNSKIKKFSKTYQFKKAIKMLVLVNKHVDTVMTFASNAEFERYYEQNRTRYIRWPATVSGTLIADCKRIEEFYQRKGCIPHFDLPPAIINEISAFYESHVYPAIPIIINIRQSKHDPNRNSESLEIKKFIEHYEKDKTYKFIIICDKSEIREDFRTLNNVLFSKDYFSDIEYDLGFIKTSHVSIFPSSGMACFAWFSKTPFIQYGNHGYHEKFTSVKKGKTFNFFSQEQVVLHGNKTAAELISSFEELIARLKEKEILQ